MQRQLHILTKIFVLTGLMMTLMVLPLNVYSQPVVKVGEYAGCYNTEVLVPVEIEHFNDVGSFTLYLDVDEGNLEFIGAEDINDVFSTGNFIAGFNPQNQIVLTWVMDFSSPANLESGIMCNLRLLYKNGSVDFDFLDDCEIVRSDLSNIDNVEYNDGSLVTFASLTPNPVTQSVLEGDPAIILLTGITTGISAQWQKWENENWVDVVEMAPYSGVHTAQLSIQAVSAEMNGNLFRCKLSNSLCSEGSRESELLVTPDGFEELDGPVKDSPIQVYPNPVGERLHCIIDVDVSYASLRLINVEGVILLNKQLGNIISGKVVSLPLESVKAGMYVLQLFDDEKLIADKKVLRK